MRKNIFILVCLAASLLLSGCQNLEQEGRPFSLYQVESIAVTPGDNCVKVAWITQDGKPDPEAFLVTWTPDAAALSGGQQSVSPDKREFLVEGLENDCIYQFTVQAQYAGGLSQKVSAKCAPRTERLAVTGFVAAAGDKRVLLRWNKPESISLSGYSISWTPGNGERSLTDASLERLMVEDLTNDTEYTFTITCKYPKGDSEAVSASATPGVVHPFIISTTEAVKFQTVTFEYNEMYFIEGDVKKVSWTFGDGSSVDGEKVSHFFTEAGEYEVKVTVTFQDDSSRSATATVKVSNFKWSEIAITKDGYIGYVKTSSVVFSHDGGTMYISTSNNRGDVFAFDTWTGALKWTYPIDKVTYGGGPMVGPDGVIYVGGRDKVFRALNPDGSQKWSFNAAGNVDGFPAVTSDNKVYMVSNGTVATFYAINAANGTAQWSKELEGNIGSAVAVDADGNIYVGTNSAIYSFTPDGAQRWKATPLVVTESGSFAIDGTTLYAGLKGDEGIVAINMANGEIKWKSMMGTNDSFSPILGPDGTIYFTSRNKKVFAFNPDGTKKWETPDIATFIYASPALSSDGKLYVGTQANLDGAKQVVTLNASTGEYTLSATEQMMCAFSFGPDRRVYYGTVTGVGGSSGGHIYAIETSGPASSWCMRGGNMQGTNSLK